MTVHPTFPGPIRQAGHVVADLDDAMSSWIALGVGPWTVIDVTQQADYRGEVSTSTVAIGLAHSGPMQIELIEAHGDARSAWHAARDTGRFGLHHIAYWTDAFDEAMAQVERASLEVVQVGDGNGMARFVYVDVPASATLVEIMELTDLSRPFMDDIRAVSEHWDGSGPTIRR